MWAFSVWILAGKNTGKLFVVGRGMCVFYRWWGGQGGVRSQDCEILLCEMPVWLTAEWEGPSRLWWLQSQRGSWLNIVRDSLHVQHVALQARRVTVNPFGPILNPWGLLKTHTSMVRPCNRILYSKKKEWIVDTCYNTNESHNNYAGWKMPEKKLHTLWFHFYGILGKTN